MEPHLNMERPWVVGQNFIEIDFWSQSTTEMATRPKVNTSKFFYGIGRQVAMKLGI